MDLQDKKIKNIDLESARHIMDYYPDDVDEHLVNECIQVKSYLLQSKPESYKSCSDIFMIMYENKLIDVFPNCYTILKIFLTLPITSCETERKHCTTNACVDLSNIYVFCAIKNIYV